MINISQYILEKYKLSRHSKVNIDVCPTYQEMLKALKSYRDGAVDLRIIFEENNLPKSKKYNKKILSLFLQEHYDGTHYNRKGFIYYEYRLGNRLKEDELDYDKDLTIEEKIKIYTFLIEKS